MDAEKKRKYITIAVIAGILLVIGGIIIGIVLSTLEDEANEINVLDIESTDNGIRIRAVAEPKGMGEVEGDGKLTIEFDGEEVYSDTIRFVQDNADMTVEFNKFVVGNGEYTTTVSYGSESDSETYEIDWVIEYAYVYAVVSDITEDNIGDLRDGTLSALSVYVTPMNNEGDKIFSMAASHKADLDAYRLTDGIKKEFKDNGKSIGNPDYNAVTDYNVVTVNEDKWLITNNVVVYLVREESGSLAVYDWNKGLAVKPKNLEADLEIYYEGSKVHETTLPVGNSATIYDGCDYYSTGAGDYEFKILLQNAMVKQDSQYYTGVCSEQKKYMNQMPLAGLNPNDFPKDDENHQSKTVELTKDEAIAGYDIFFDASYSLNDGPLVYQWDWDYFNDIEEDAEPFHIEDTGETITHTFNPSLSFLSPFDHYYIGLKVVGEEDVEVMDDLDGASHTEKESHIIIIHIHFKLKTL